jgi:hypothetical protein
MGEARRRKLKGAISFKSPGKQERDAQRERAKALSFGYPVGGERVDELGFNDETGEWEKIA